MPHTELCRKGGFSDATFYKWRAKFGGLDVPDAKRLRVLEGENAKRYDLSERPRAGLRGYPATVTARNFPA